MSASMAPFELKLLEHKLKYIDMQSPQMHLTSFGMIGWTRLIML